MGESWLMANGKEGIAYESLDQFIKMTFVTACDMAKADNFQLCYTALTIFRDYLPRGPLSAKQIDELTSLINTSPGHDRRACLVLLAKLAVSHEPGTEIIASSSQSELTTVCNTAYHCSDTSEVRYDSP